MAQVLPVQCLERHQKSYQCSDGNNLYPSKQKDKPCNLLSSGRKRRTRTIFSPSQIAELEHNFLQASYLTPQRLIDVCSKLGLAKAQVKVWYKNRRRRNKLSMEKHRKDDPFSCSPSPSSVIDQMEGYPNSIDYHDSEVDNGIVPPTSSHEAEACNNSSNLYNPNHDSKRLGMYSTATWYQASHSNQTDQNECKPLPSVDRIIKPNSVTINCKDNKTCTPGVLSRSTWNAQSVLDLQTAPAKSTSTAGSIRSFYNQNRVANELSDNNFLCTMDSLMRTYTYQTTPSQFAYCFS